MKVLVTGGAGFFGSHLVDALVEAGDEVIVIDHHFKEKRRYPNPAATYYKIRFADPKIEEIFKTEKPEAVIHLAAQIEVVRSIADPVYDAQTNILDSIALLEAAKRQNCKKIIFASSGGAIYGDCKKLPISEIMDTQPLSPYGISKQTFEYYLNAARREGMKCSILRFANLYGPRQLPHGDSGNVFGIFIKKLLAGEPCVIYGDGTSTRDYLFVTDAVDGLMLALKKDFDGLVNISSGREVSLNELWAELTKLHQGKAQVQYQPFRTGEIYRSCLSCDLARQQLGWQPKISFADGIKKTYEWFKNQT